MSEFEAHVDWPQSRSDHRLPWRIHARDAGKWLREVAFPRCRPDLGRFMIFGMGRSGSTTLVHLLDSHPGLTCENEILRKHRLFPLSHVETRVRHAPSASVAFGFHLKPWHITRVLRREPIAFMRQLDAAGYRVIYLERRNAFLKSLSVLKLHSHGVIHARSDAAVPRDAFPIEPSQLIGQMRSAFTFKQLERASLGALTRPHVEVVYESDLLHAKSHEGTCARLFEFLGVDPAPVSTPLKRVSPRDWRAGVSNADEVEAAMHEAGLGDFVRMADAAGLLSAHVWCHGARISRGQRPRQGDSTLPDGKPALAKHLLNQVCARRGGQ